MESYSGQSWLSSEQSQLIWHKHLRNNWLSIFTAAATGITVFTGCYSWNKTLERSPNKWHTVTVLIWLWSELFYDKEPNQFFCNLKTTVDTIICLSYCQTKYIFCLIKKAYGWIQVSMTTISQKKSQTIIIYSWVWKIFIQ